MTELEASQRGGVSLSAEKGAARPLLFSPAALALATLAVFTAAELMVTYGNAVAGMAIHAVILTGLLGAGLASEGGEDVPSQALGRLLYALTLVPLIRILSLAMPLSRFEQAYWYVAAGLPVLVAAVVVAATLGLRPRELGLRFSLSPWQPAVALLGFLLGFMEYQILAPDPLIDELRPLDFILPALILMVFTGFLEELVFRGILQQTASAFLGGFAIIYVSLVFAILHIGYRSATDVAFVLGIALIYAWVVRRTGSIMGVSVSHGITNITLFLLVPFIPALAVKPDWLTLP